MDGNYNIVSILKERVPKYCGIDVKSEAFIQFITEYNASENVINKFNNIAFLGQLELYNGVVFSVKEIIIRNEFISGENIFIGINDVYEYIILSLKSGKIGFLSYENRTDNTIGNKKVRWEYSSLEEFFIDQLKPNEGDFDKYLISKIFNTKVLDVMELISNATKYKFKKPPLLFKKWLIEVGFDKGFCFFDKVLINDMSGLFSFETIMQMNPKERRLMNPSFFVIGSTPDGGFVVLDRRVSPYQVGYVAIHEVGDEDSWQNYYIKVSNDLGSYLHDLVFLDIIPGDYYDAKQLESTESP